MTAYDDSTPAAALLQRAQRAVVARRRAPVDDLEVCLAWADLHGEAPAAEVPGGDRLVRLGGDGTPPVRDLCLEELAIARGVHVLNTSSALADALDLRHRLPKLWAAVKALECEPWVARKVARMSRKLSAQAVGLVDEAVAAAIHQEPSRVLAIAEAKIIEADTALFEAELDAKRREHGVWLGRIRPADPEDPDSGRGVQTVYAKLLPAHALWLDQTVDRLADLLQESPALAAQYGLREEPGQGTPSRDQARAVALGLLARPHEAADLLDTDTDDTDDAATTRTAPRQRATVYVHLHEGSLLAGQGVARAEAFGPVLVQRLADLLGHTHIDLKPVIDLNAGASVNAYEHPTRMRERAHLRMAGDVFPHASSLSRRLDADHPVPYDPGGPPGQTNDANLAPLSRHSHRAKTHLGYRVEQLDPATYLWTTPHGLVCLVDPSGTRLLDEAAADRLRRAAKGTPAA